MHRSLLIVLPVLAPPASAATSTIMYRCDNDICTVRPDGSHRHALTHAGSHSRNGYAYPQLARTGRLMTFGHAGHMYTADATAHHRHRIREPKKPGYVWLAPTLSPSGRAVFYFYGFFYNPGATYFWPCRSSLTTNARPHCGSYHQTTSREDLSWGPHGKLVSYDSDDRSALCITSLDLTCGNAWVARTNYPDEFVGASSPSPDNRLIASGVNIHGNGQEYRIALFDAKTTKQRRYVTRGHMDTGPVWSPNGRWLAFQRKEAVGGNRTTTSICIVRANGGHVSCPVQRRPNISTPTWGP